MDRCRPGGTGTRRSRTARLVSAIAAVTLLAACHPVFGDDTGVVRRATLTSTSGLTYRYSGDTTALTAEAMSPFPDGNVREVTWRDTALWRANQESCTTWDSTAESVWKQDPARPGLTQPGLAMRIAQTPDGSGFRAVTVTENIWFAGIWQFNVHTWDTTRPGDPFEIVATFDLSSIVGTWYNHDGTLVDAMAPPPWHVCGQTHGVGFRFKVWTGDDPEPPWDDPTHVFETTLPDGWNYAGYSGDYIGHLPDGATAAFRAHPSYELCGAPDMIDTPLCRPPVTTTTNPTESG